MENNKSKTAKKLSKKAIILLSTLIPVGAAGVATAIAVPIAVTQKKKDSGETEKYEACVTLSATSESVLTWDKGFSSSWLKYSTDGKNWIDVKNGTPVTFGTSGKQTLYLTGKLASNYTAQGLNNIKIVPASGQPASVTLSGNLLKFLKDDTLTQESLCYLFKDSTGLLKIDESKEKLLPSKEMKPHCFAHMFMNCSNLINAPELPIESLAKASCYSMFYGCSKLKVSQGEPASCTAKGKIFTCPTSIPENAVTHMFENTGGTFKSSDLSPGKTYYWYTE